MERISIELDKAERGALNALRRKFNDCRAERALAVLRCADGLSASAISKILERNVHSVLGWLKAYKARGIEGLSRASSPGRPVKRSKTLRENLETWLSKTPCDYGWGEEVWTAKTLIAQHKKETGITLSHDTVGRILDKNGYSFTRGKLTVPSSAPSKEAKLARVKQIAAEILALKAKGDVEVMFLDESHFSTEPYVTRGYHKRGKPFFPPKSEKKGKLHDIWGIRAGKRRFLLEKL